MRTRIILLAALTAAFWLGVPAISGAASPDEALLSPAQEERVRAISRSLRCLVCQNQSIEESNAPLARDLRQIVRERIAAGDGDQDVREYLVVRYGDWVLLNPPFNLRTALLWVGPFVLLLGAALGVGFWYRRQGTRASAASDQPLTADERRRLQALLGRTDGADGGRE